MEQQPAFMADLLRAYYRCNFWAKIII